MPDGVCNPTKPKRVLAVASGGGHWIELLRLRTAWEDCDIAYVTTDPGYRDQVAPARFYTVKDGNRWTKFALIRQMLEILWLLLRERPDVIITTGAAPGFFALRIGKLLQAKTCWIDSIANVDQLSLSGKLIGPHADLWLTQWPHLAKDSGPCYSGAVV